MITRKDLEKFRKQKVKECKAKKIELGFDFKNLVHDYPDASYYVAFGERGAGKTYTALDYALEQWKFEGKTIGYVRRHAEMLKKKHIGSVFLPFEQNGYVEFITEGMYDRVVYRSGEWYFAKNAPDGTIEYMSPDPFAYAFAISLWENYKGNSYPTTDTVILDEFITKALTPDDEFANFQNILSTVFRQRDGVKIFLAGNTVNRYCPYFREMGLTNAGTMPIGAIDCYTYGDSRLKVVVTHTEPSVNGHPNDFLFAFDNPRLKMITESAWEIDTYPHLKMKYGRKDIVVSFFIKYSEETVKCDVVRTEYGNVILNIQPHKYEIKDLNAIIYDLQPSPLPNYRTNIFRPHNKRERMILDIITGDKVFYATNQAGEIVRHYLVKCRD